MQRLVKPNPVAAMLDIKCESLPLASARSFTWPVLGLASFQKKSKLARWISSRSCSSVPWNGAPLGSMKEGAERFWQLASVTNGKAMRPIPQRRTTSLLLRRVLFVMVYEGPSSLLCDFQRGLNALARVVSDPHRDFCRLRGQLLLIIPDGE